MSRGPALALAVAASLAAHAKGISAPLLDYHFHRQCNTAAIARNYHRNGLNFAIPQVDWEGDYKGKAATEFPLYMWLMGLFWPLFGLGELWGRLLSVSFSALTAVYLFLLLERRLKREEALSGAVLFSFIPLEVYFGRTVQPEALALMSTTAALYHWDAWLRKPGAKMHWAAATAFAFLAFAHKLPYLYLLGPLAAMAWHDHKRPWADPRSLGACALAVGSTVAWYRYASTGLFVVPSHPHEFLKMLEYDQLPYFMFFQFFSRLPELAATYGGMLLLGLGAWQLLRVRGSWFFAYWWLSVAFSLVIAGGYAHWHEYTSLPLAPVNAAFMGAGLIWLSKRAATGAAKAALAALILSIPIHSALRIKHWYRNGYPYLSHARAAANAVSRASDLFVCNERTSSVFLYYLDRKGWAWSVKEAGPEQSIALLKERIRGGARFYASERSMLEEGSTTRFREHLGRHAQLAYDRGGLQIFQLTGR